MILERLLSAVSVLLLIGCMIAPLKKTAFAQRLQRQIAVRLQKEGNSGK